MRENCATPVAEAAKAVDTGQFHYFGGWDVPVFILTIYGKGDKANLTRAERNYLAETLPQLADHYRKTAQVMVAKRRRKQQQRNRP